MIKKLHNEIQKTTIGANCNLTYCWELHTFDRAKKADLLLEKFPRKLYQGFLDLHEVH